MWLNTVQGVWKKLFHFRMFPMSSCSILDKEETHYVPLVVFCEALHLHQESIQWQTMQTAPRNMTDSWPTKSRKQWPKYTHHTSSAEDSWLFLVPFSLDKLRDWYWIHKVWNIVPRRAEGALASEWDGNCSQQCLPVSGIKQSIPKQTASQDLAYTTAGSDSFHLICWHL